jgi:hypothetical protein
MRIGNSAVEFINIPDILFVRFASNIEKAIMVCLVSLGEYGHKTREDVIFTLTA